MNKQQYNNKQRITRNGCQKISEDHRIGNGVQATSIGGHFYCNIIIIINRNNNYNHKNYNNYNNGGDCYR